MITLIHSLVIQNQFRIAYLVGAESTDLEAMSIL